MASNRRRSRGAPDPAALREDRSLFEARRRMPTNPEAHAGRRRRVARRTLRPTRPSAVRSSAGVQPVKYAQNNALHARTFHALADKSCSSRSGNGASRTSASRHRPPAGQCVVRDRAARALLVASGAIPRLRRKPAARCTAMGTLSSTKAYHSVPPEYLGRGVWVRGESCVVRILIHLQE